MYEDETKVRRPHRSTNCDVLVLEGVIRRLKRYNFYPPKLSTLRSSTMNDLLVFSDDLEVTGLCRIDGHISHRARLQDYGLSAQLTSIVEALKKGTNGLALPER